MLENTASKITASPDISEIAPLNREYSSLTACVMQQLLYIHICISIKWPNVLEPIDLCRNLNNSILLIIPVIYLSVSRLS